MTPDELTAVTTSLRRPAVVLGADGLARRPRAERARAAWIVRDLRQALATSSHTDSGTCTPAWWRRPTVGKHLRAVSHHGGGAPQRRRGGPHHLQRQSEDQPTGTPASTPTGSRTSPAHVGGAATRPAQARRRRGTGLRSSLCLPVDPGTAARTCIRRMPGPTQGAVAMSYSVISATPTSPTRAGPGRSGCSCCCAAKPVTGPWPLSDGHGAGQPGALGSGVEGAGEPEQLGDVGAG